MGNNSFKKFFDVSKARSVSLSMTQEVLQEHECLQTGLRSQIDNGLAKMERMMQERTILETHKAEITANKNFTRKIKVPKFVKIDVNDGQYVTNCSVCNFTSHSNCAYSNDNDKIRCSVMTNGKCTVCKGKCDWHRHKNMSFYYDSIMEDSVATLDDLKEKYDTAVDSKNRQETMIRNLENELGKVKADVKAMVRKVQKSLHRLDQIALKPNPLTETDHLNLLIETNKKSRLIKFYEEAKRDAEIFKKAQTGNENFLPDDEEGAKSAQPSTWGKYNPMNLFKQ